MAIINGSVVDYLNSVGQSSDYNSRSALATKYNIQNYVGSADQNTKLLNYLTQNNSTPATNVINNSSPTIQTPATTPIAPVIDTNSSSYNGSAINMPGYVPASTTAPVITTAYLNGANTVLTQAQQQQQIADQQAKTVATQQQDALNKYNDVLAKQQDTTTADIANTTTDQNNILSNISDLSQPFRQTYEDAQRNTLSVNENFQQNQNLVNELGTLLQEGNDLIQQQKGVTGLASIRDPRINQTINSVNARVGVIQAVMAARNSQISVANNLIDRGLNAITADRQDQLNYYNTLLNLNDKKLLDLNSRSKDLANAQIDSIKSELDTANASADYIKKLMTTPETATYIANAGVTLNDSVDTINQKLATYGNQQEINTVANDYIKNGYTQTPIKQANSTIVNAGGKELYFTPPISVSSKFNTPVKTTTTVPNSDLPITQAQRNTFLSDHGWIPPDGALYSDVLNFIAAYPDLQPADAKAQFDALYYGTVGTGGDNTPAPTETPVVETKPNIIPDNNPAPPANLPEDNNVFSNINNWVKSLFK